MKWLLSSGAVALALVIIMTVAASRHQQPTPVLPFDEQWNGAEALLAFDEWPKPNTVKTIVIRPPQQPLVEEELVPEPEPKIEQRRKPPRDICRGKGRIYYNGGRTWRCRR